MQNIERTINYIEFPLVDTLATIAFYTKAFGWAFQEWGPDYLSFSGAGIEGGFNREDGVTPATPGVLVILYSASLEKIQEDIEAAGGSICRPIYSFPGGRRFHFNDPNGNELAVWSENEAR